MLHDPRYETKIRARQILLKAADYMEAHGWCQQVLQYRGRVCLLGALRAVNCSFLDGDNPALISEISERLRQATGTYSSSEWNDRKGRTGEEVVAALRLAASY